MKNLMLFVIIIFFGCKSTENTKNNQLDVSKIKTETIDKEIKVSQISLNEFEITLHTANPKEKVSITDEKGNKKTFENIKKINLKKKSEIKKDSVSSDKSNLHQKETDNSTINEDFKKTSGSNDAKGIAIALACIIGFATIIFLVVKYKR